MPVMLNDTISSRTNARDQANYVLCSYCTICFLVNRANWAKDATKFVMSLQFVSEAESIYDCMPKPILTKMDNPKRIRYAIQNDRVLVCNIYSQ